MFWTGQSLSYARVFGFTNPEPQSGHVRTSSYTRGSSLLAERSIAKNTGCGMMIKVSDDRELKHLHTFSS